MPRLRRDIRNEEVLKLLADPEYDTIVSVAQRLDCSTRLVRAVRDGIRKQPGELPTSSVCECCGQNPVKPGNKKLCTHCFENIGPYYDAFSP
jgi:hypothetical protein